MRGDSFVEKVFANQTGVSLELWHTWPLKFASQNRIHA